MFIFIIQKINFSHINIQTKLLITKRTIMEQYSRTINLIGQNAFDKIFNKSVMIIGIGGVGGYVCEALARAGVSNFILIDNDTVSISNLNRQIIALNSTIGQPKVEVMKNRILDINPNANVVTQQIFLTQQIVETMEFDVDYVIDCIDNVSAKIALAFRADRDGFDLISCMGTGNKLSPELFEITDIYKTEVCPLAKVMRKELKSKGVKKLTVLYSKEPPVKIGQRTPASISFTPSIAGLRIAEYVIKKFIQD